MFFFSLSPFYIVLVLADKKIDLYYAVFFNLSLTQKSEAPTLSCISIGSSSECPPWTDG